MKLTNKNDKTLKQLTKNFTTFNALDRSMDSICSSIYWSLTELLYDSNFQYITAREAFEIGQLKEKFNNHVWQKITIPTVILSYKKMKTIQEAVEKRKKEKDGKVK